MNIEGYRIEAETLLREDGISRKRSGLPISIPGYCPQCHLFNHLPCKSKDGQDICRACWRKENEPNPKTNTGTTS